MNRTLALLAFALATAPVYAGERTAVISIKPLLIAALEHGSARGVIAGLTRYVKKGHIARAALEATAFQTREVLDAMNADSGVDLTAFEAIVQERLTGGGDKHHGA